MRKQLKALGGIFMRIYFLFLITVFFIILYFSENSNADITYIIKKGDNPSKIAKKFHVKASDIIEINNLNEYKIIPGTKILIPSNTNRKKDNKNITPVMKKSTEKITNNTEKNTNFYIVKKGDTLSSISKKYKISIKDIKELNNLSSLKLKIGQKLIVEKSACKTYTVKKGDSIYKIAKKFNKSVEEIKEINGLDSNLLKPDQKIVLQFPSKPEKDEIKFSKNDTKKIEEFKNEVEMEQEEKLTLKEKVVVLAKKLLNIPYRFGGNTLFGLDCSAFVQIVYGFIGIDLPRSAREQFNEGNPVKKEELSIGDLVFFRTYTPFPSHVGIYLGNNLFIHASSKKKKVTIDSLQTPYYFKRFIGAKRLLGVEKTAELKMEDE